MDAGLAWTALGTLASAAGAVVAWRQLRLQPRPGGQPEQAGPDLGGASVLPPTGRLPGAVRGRDDVLGELTRRLRRLRGTFVVLAGMGGVGKSTVAAALAAQVRDGPAGLRRRPAVWWVSVTDPSSLTSAMATVARQLGAPAADLEAIAAGRLDGADRLWEHLDGARRRWLLVLDNADDPEVLARRRPAPGTPAVSDGDGWLRPSRRGLVVVTSRDDSPTTWGRHARIVPIEPLDDLDAARVLLDWAPAAGSDSEARRLARRLGGLPLALGIAGSYLRSDVVLRPSFPDYQHGLDAPGEAAPLLADGPAGADPRAIVTSTWELSLDALSRRGVPQARPLLRLLSCYAASTPIPIEVLGPQLLVPLLGSSSDATPGSAERRLDDGLRELRRLRLIDARPAAPTGQRAVAVHPVIADTNRVNLTADPVDDVDPALVRHTAARLVIASLDDLDPEEPGDWQRYRALDPHLHALFETAAPHLDHDVACTLVRVAALAASAHGRAGALHEGERLSRAALTVLPLLGDDPAALVVRHEVAWLTAVRGRLDEAEAIHVDLLARRERHFGPDHPETLRSRNEVAWVAAGQGRWAEAEAIYREGVLTARERALGTDHPDTVASRVALDRLRSGEAVPAHHLA